MSSEFTRDEVKGLRDEVHALAPVQEIVLQVFPLRFDGRHICVRLQENAPSAAGATAEGVCCVPEGVLHAGESLTEGARRVLAEHTRLEGAHFEQVRAELCLPADSGAEGSGTLCLVYAALLPCTEGGMPEADGQVPVAVWCPTSELPSLPPTVQERLAATLRHLRTLTHERPVFMHLLGDFFSMNELQRLYEIIHRRTYDRRNFQRRILQTDLVEQRADAVRHHADGVPRGRRPFLFRLRGTELKIKMQSGENPFDF